VITWRSLDTRWGCKGSRMGLLRHLHSPHSWGSFRATRGQRLLGTDNMIELCHEIRLIFEERGAVDRSTPSIVSTHAQHRNLLCIRETRGIIYTHECVHICSIVPWTWNQLCLLFEFVLMPTSFRTISRSIFFKLYSNRSRLLPCGSSKVNNRVETCWPISIRIMKTLMFGDL
jgi:hypothetical protein